MRKKHWTEVYTVTRLLADFLRGRARTTAELNCIAAQFAFRSALLFEEAKDKKAAAMRFYAMADKLAIEAEREKLH